MPIQEQVREEIYTKFRYYTQLHLPDEKILLSLERAGASNEEIDTIKEFFKKQKQKARHSRGVLLTCAGSILLVAGFIITAILFHQNFPFMEIMYGGTGLGLILLIYGIYELF